MTEYLLAQTNEHYAAAAKLFATYAAWLNIDLSFQHFDEELTQLKEMYSAPLGGIILCKENDIYIGCVAIRKIDNETGELKRMYVEPAHQKKGIGKRLLEHAIVLAKDCGYASIKLDTLNYMEPAIQLYKKYGFYEIAPYYFNPNASAVYFELPLDQTSFLG